MALSLTAFDPLGAGASEKAAKRLSLRVLFNNYILSTPDELYFLHSRIKTTPLYRLQSHVI